MRRALAWILLVPLAAIVLVFAVANRQWVTVSFDPFSSEAPAYAVGLPLFLLVFIALIAGVVIGGMAVWFGKVRWRWAAHRAEREAARLRAEKAEAERRMPVEGVRIGTQLPPP